MTNRTVAIATFVCTGIAVLAGTIAEAAKDVQEVVDPLADAREECVFKARQHEQELTTSGEVIEACGEYVRLLQEK